MSKPPAITFHPVFVDGKPALIDIFVNGQWDGSRRTMQQACMRRDHLRWQHRLDVSNRKKEEPMT